MRGAWVAWRRMARTYHRPPGNIKLAKMAPARQSLDDMAVAIARGECATCVGTCWVLVQHLLDQAYALEPVSPVDRIERAHASDGVAHRCLSGCLALMFGMNQRLDRVEWHHRLLLEPGYERANIVLAVVVTKLVYQLHGKGW